MVVEVAPGNAVRVDLGVQAGSARGTLVLLHGMCGSAESPYMRWCAAAAVRRGWVAARMNLRTCGGTELLATTLYNAGQSDDLTRVLEALDRARLPRPFAVAGVSLGGNIVLREAGRSGAECRADAVAAVNPPVDLAACAAAIERPRNRVYRWYFVQRLCDQLRRASRRRGAGPRPWPWAVRTVRRFDERYTAPDGGYRGADEYYENASSGPWLGGIARPAWILSAVDDPFVEAAIFTRWNPGGRVRIDHPAGGGHCGYRQWGRPAFWPAEALLDYFESVTPRRSRRIPVRRP